MTPGGFSSQGPWAVLTVSCEAPFCCTQTIKVQLRRSPALQIDLSVTPQLQPWRRPSQLHAWLCSSKIPVEERQQRRGQGEERGRERARAEEIPKDGGRQNWRNYVVPETPQESRDLQTERDLENERSNQCRVAEGHWCEQARQCSPQSQHWESRSRRITSLGPAWDA